MKHRTAYLFNALFVLLLSCNTKDKARTHTDDGTHSSVSKGSALNDTATALIQKEFADTVVTAKAVGAPVLLRFNLQNGKTYNYTMSLDLLQQKGEISRGTAMRWNYDVKVLDNKNRLKTLEATYKQINMTVNMGNGQKMEFSSENKVEAMDFMQMPSKMFGIIKGKSFTMQVDEKGKVVSVTGFDKIGEAVVNEMGLPEEMKPMARQNFQKQFNDDAVKQLFSQTFDALPNKNVKVGDTWKSSSELSSMKQSIVTVYRVKKINGDRVYLTGDSKLTSAEGQTSASQTSQLIMDSKSGLMIDGVFDQESSDGKMKSKTRITGKES